MKLLKSQSGKLSGVLLGFLVLLGLIAFVGFTAVGKYNGMVTAEEGVNEKWAQVENVYQRRMDLIPNLVNTVKGYASHEKETLEAVIKARASATQVTSGAMQNILNDPQSFENFQASQGALTSALSKLMVVVEKYPDLKANEGFLNLQSQLEGTENRITVERMRFNEVAKDFNILVKRFPNNLFAGFFGFHPRPLFKAADGANVAPQVQF